MSEAIKQFADYFAKNYPADTVIVDPHWHAPRIFRAVVAALSAEQQEPFAYFRKDSSFGPWLETTADNPNAVPAYSASPIAAPASQPTEELEAMTRMFHAACADLGQINEALGLDSDDGGAEPILDAIEELKAKASQPDAAAIRNKALEECAQWVDQRRFDFEKEHGVVDWSTGFVEYGTGQRAQLQEEYAAELAEIAEGLRALATQSPAQQDVVAWMDEFGNFTDIESVAKHWASRATTVTPLCVAQQAGQPAPALPEWLPLLKRVAAHLTRHNGSSGYRDGEQRLLDDVRAMINAAPAQEGTTK